MDEANCPETDDILLECENSYFDRRINLLKRFLIDINHLKENYITKELVNPDDLRKELENLGGLNENQTSSFANELFEIFYEKAITLFDGISLNRNNQSIFKHYSTYGYLHFSLYLPFYDKNQSKISKENCTSLWDLPKFYLIETRSLENNYNETKNDP